MHAEKTLQSLDNQTNCDMLSRFDERERRKSTCLYWLHCNPEDMVLHSTHKAINIVAFITTPAFSHGMKRHCWHE